MYFLKFIIFNFLLVVSQVLCDKQRLLSCVEKGENPSLSGFKVRFYLSTHQQRNNHKINVTDPVNLKTILNQQGFQENRRTVVLIHGFLTDHKTKWMVKLKDILVRKSFNVIQIDWSDAFFDKDIDVDLTDINTYLEAITETTNDALATLASTAEEVSEYFDFDDDYEDSDDESDDSDEEGAAYESIIPEELNPLDYRSAALRTGVAAAYLADFLLKLSNAHPRPKSFLTNLHLIGHSLGAHIAGQTGRLVRMKGKVSVSRVTGLDPAYPCFHPDKKPSLKLDVHDAKFVDVIHTNSEPKDNQNRNLGTHDVLGHLDFYPHRGFNQPECNNRKGKFLNENTIKELLIESVSFITRTVANVDATNVVLKYLNNTLPGKEKYDIVCDHGEAPNYFIKSFTEDIYAAPAKIPIETTSIPTLTNRLNLCKRTKTCVTMGFFSVNYASRPGTYYADTTISTVRAKLSTKG